MWRQSEEALRRAGHDPSKISIDMAVKSHTDGKPDNVLNVHYDSFLPKEYRLFLEDVVKIHLHFYPIDSSLVSSLKHFLQTYTSLEIIKLLPFSFDSRTNAYSDENIALLHNAFLALARKMILIVLPKRPVYITIDGEVKKLSVSVDGVVVKTSPTQTRGVATLALLKYDRWFPLEEFCKIAFPEVQVDPQKSFDEALRFLKLHEPFGWDPDIGIRRIKGAVVESLVDEAVLRAHLSQSTKK